jgi:hypothetical protein
LNCAAPGDVTAFRHRDWLGDSEQPNDTDIVVMHTIENLTTLGKVTPTMLRNGDILRITAEKMPCVRLIWQRLPRGKTYLGAAVMESFILAKKIRRIFENTKVCGQGWN